MSRKFAWSHPRFQRLADPQKVGEALEAVREKHGGALRAADIVTAAKSKKSPLHKLFEWDDTEAAQKHRNHQARTIITSIRIKVIDREDSEVRRIYVNVHQAEGRAYLPIELIKQDIMLEAEVLKQAMAGLKQWRDRFKDLRTQLSPLFESIDSTLQDVAESITEDQAG